MSTRKTSHSSDKSHKLCQITNTSKEESPVYLPVAQIVSCCQMVNFLRELFDSSLLLLLLRNDIKDTFQRIGGARYQDVINDLKTDCMDADIEKDYQELFREWLKDEDCVTDKSHEDEMVKKARKEDDLEGSIETYEQNLGKEGLCDLLLLILSFNLIVSFV